MNDVFILDAVRTRLGRYAGALSTTRPDDLAAAVVGELVRRSPALDPAAIDDAVLGDANGAGEDNRNVARMASLLAGLPPSVPGQTVNRLCGSGLQAVFSASQAIAAGDASLCIAGGVESMSRSPWVVLKPQTGLPRASETLHSTTLGWRMVNPCMPGEWTVSLGEGAEILADRHRITRSAAPGLASRAPSPTSCTAAAAVMAWPRSASVSARDWPWCSRAAERSRGSSPMSRSAMGFAPGGEADDGDGWNGCDGSAVRRWSMD